MKEVIFSKASFPSSFVFFLKSIFFTEQVWEAISQTGDFYYKIMLQNL